ncbi:hypothetical protein QBC46DRAFT_141820 [Diplogelasinospora grovesii]|uniref:Uncharacterized protein n=1 Tax=Diplogelasinospora grovesii TaxID=303347 RepID=A0AAN6N5V8_9PEZI|nr:hypothetical protein QBC46DRAFT_141820 [Diplogelasinospora grovesii]
MMLGLLSWCHRSPHSIWFGQNYHKPTHQSAIQSTRAFRTAILSLGELHLSETLLLVVDLGTTEFPARRTNLNSASDPARLGLDGMHVCHRRIPIRSQHVVSPVDLARKAMDSTFLVFSCQILLTNLHCPPLLAAPFYNRCKRTLSMTNRRLCCCASRPGERCLFGSFPISKIELLFGCWLRLPGHTVYCLVASVRTLRITTAAIPRSHCAK